MLDLKFWFAIFEQFSLKLNPQSTSPEVFIKFSCFSTSSSFEVCFDETWRPRIRILGNSVFVLFV
jgi:hypothetical protein